MLTRSINHKSLSQAESFSTCIKITNHQSPIINHQPAYHLDVHIYNSINHKSPIIILNHQSSNHLTEIEVICDLREVISALKDVDLPRGRPLPVHVVLRHHPEGRPQPLQKQDNKTTSIKQKSNNTKKKRNNALKNKHQHQYCCCSNHTRHELTHNRYFEVHIIKPNKTNAFYFSTKDRNQPPVLCIYNQDGKKTPARELAFGGAQAMDNKASG